MTQITAMEKEMRFFSITKHCHNLYVLFPCRNVLRMCNIWTSARLDCKQEEPWGMRLASSLQLLHRSSTCNLPCKGNYYRHTITLVYYSGFRIVWYFTKILTSPMTPPFLNHIKTTCTSAKSTSKRFKKKEIIWTITIFAC